ncbi:MAG: DUF1549 domain-containing protein, partial [Planctomycetota bacterium]
MTLNLPSLVSTIALLAATSADALAVSTAAQRQRDPQKVFSALKRRADKNLDGRITADEFDRGKRAFRRLDLDGDGVITLEDVKARMEKGRKGDPKPKADSGRDAGPGMEMGSTPGGAFSADAIDFFESRVRPVLANECFSCHAEGGRKRGGLALDSRHGFLVGGESGEALVPGDVDASLFIEAIRYEDLGFAMPPKNKLSAQEIADLEAWVRMGAPWPDEVPPSPDEMIDASPRDFSDGDETASLNRDIDIEAGAEFWSFQPVLRPDAPLFEDDEWSRSDVDRFLLASMAEAGVEPVGDADDRTWLRRVTLDLTGLPPTPSEIAAYEADRSPLRDATVVDRLLASPGYAERWGRHWLDVARYGESSGKDRNVLYPHAWRYRDWVLEAFRDDMPYDEFLRRQIAGDLMPAASDEERARNQIATGFLAIGPKGHGTRDRVTFQLETVDEQIDAMSRGMLGLTVSCARCHDHKFDPIPTADYYALAGIFMSTETHFGTFKAAGNNQPSDLIELPANVGLPTGPSMAPGVLAILKRGADRLDMQIEEGNMKKESGDRAQAERAPHRPRPPQDPHRRDEDQVARHDPHG